MGLSLSSSKVTIAAGCQALASCPWSTKRSPTSWDPIQSGANLGARGTPIEASELPPSRPYPIVRPSSGTFGDKRLGRYPELSDFV